MEDPSPWSNKLGRLVTQLISDLSKDLPLDERCLVERFGILPIGWSLWVHYGLSTRGEVLTIGEDEDDPDAVRVHTDRNTVLKVLVWGSERYPELTQLLPRRSPDALDCRCQGIPLLAIGEVICPWCCGLGWIEDPEFEV